MTFTIFAFASRRPDLTPDEYREYYENHHQPLINSLLGDAVPLAYLRHYPKRSPDATHNFPVELLGGEGSLDFDSITESVFEDEAHMESCMAELDKPEKKKLRDKDAAKFIDMTKLKAIAVRAHKNFPPGESSFLLGKE